MKRAASAGLTLLEIVIASTIFSVLLVMTMSVFMTYNDHSAQRVAVVDLEMKVTRVEKFLRTELSSISAASGGGGIVLSDPTGLGEFTRAEYTPVIGYNVATSTPLFGFRRRLEFRLDAGETINNVSDDGDRYIDEGSLILIVDSNNNGAFEASEEVVVATNLASGAETYPATTLGTVGAAFAFALGDQPLSGGAGPSTYQGQTTTGNLGITMTFLGPMPTNATSIELRTETFRYALRNP